MKPVMQKREAFKVPLIKECSPSRTSLGTCDVISLVKQDEKSFCSYTCDIHVKNVGRWGKIAKGAKVS